MAESGAVKTPRPPAPIFRSVHSATTAQANPLLPSSSPAFATPLHPIRRGPAAENPLESHAAPLHAVLPVNLPPQTLRPLAVRTFNKHGLTLRPSALQKLATFIGTHCGAEWREQGLGELVLEDVAKSWKAHSSRVRDSLIVDGDTTAFQEILQNLRECMAGGRIMRDARRRDGQTGEESSHAVASKSATADQGDTQLEVEDALSPDPRRWLQVVNAFSQPALSFNMQSRLFEKLPPTPASPFADPAAHTSFFRNRYSLVLQRLLRHATFQLPAVMHSRSASEPPRNTLTLVANLLGRGGSSHVLLGLLTRLPTGCLAISDLSGTVRIDLSEAQPGTTDEAWFVPGMIVLIEGVYVEEGTIAGSKLGGREGVGGLIGGTFVGMSIGAPPCERREVTIGGSQTTASQNPITAHGVYGWVDFLGVGSEKNLGASMRRNEQALRSGRGEGSADDGRMRVVIVGEVMLDRPRTVQALRQVLGHYERSMTMPICFVLTGNFVSHAALAGEGGSSGSAEYQGSFDALASVLSDYPSLLRAAIFVFIPGDKDPWASAFSAGAATVVPRGPIPEAFTQRFRRVFASANAEADVLPGVSQKGTPVWTSNPARLSIFGPVQEMVVFRDDISGRLRRSAITFAKAESEDVAVEGGASGQSQNQGQNGDQEPSIDVQMGVGEEVSDPVGAPQRSRPDAETLEARKLVKTILDQGHLSPFPIATRPVRWSGSGPNALQLYPLPTAFVLVDPEAPAFALTYEGCHCMNPGALVVAGGRGGGRRARWIEYDAMTRRGRVLEANF